MSFANLNIIISKKTIDKNSEEIAAAFLSAEEEEEEPAAEAAPRCQDKRYTFNPKYLNIEQGYAQKSNST